MSTVQDTALFKNILNVPAKSNGIMPYGTYIEALDYQRESSQGHQMTSYQCKQNQASYGGPSSLHNDLPTPFDEKKCLKMILNPEFVENLTVLK